MPEATTERPRRATAVDTYRPLPLPKAKHPDRVVYAVLLEGGANPYPAELIERVPADVVDTSDLASPWNYPELRPGERVSDYMASYRNPEPKRAGRVTIRGWKILGKGPLMEQVAFELREAAVCSAIRRQVLAVFLWCPAVHGNTRLGEHGAFWGAGQTPVIEDDMPRIPPALVSPMQKPFGKHSDGTCPLCILPHQPGEDRLENQETVDDAVERAHWLRTGQRLQRRRA